MTGARARFWLRAALDEYRKADPKWDVLIDLDARNDDYIRVSSNHRTRKSSPTGKPLDQCAASSFL
jgi:hypothetical protein